LKRKHYCMALLVIGSVLLFMVNSAIGSSDLSTLPTPKQQMTPEQKKFKEELDLKLKGVWDEIKTDFNVDSSQYFQLELSNLQKFKEKQSIIQDEVMIDKILTEVIDPYRAELPIGSIKPIILIKNDGSEVIFGYKEADGTNVLKKSTFSNGTLKKNEEKKMGTKLELEINK